MLDLMELADEWREGLDTLGEASAPDYEKHDLVDSTEEIRVFAEELGHYDPDNLRYNSIDLVDEGDFLDHARVLASDLVGGDFLEWPLSCIDWSQAADELRSDYSEIDFRSTTYLYRA